MQNCTIQLKYVKKKEILALKNITKINKTVD